MHRTEENQRQLFAQGSSDSITHGKDRFALKKN